ncbi:NADH-quinone oxidoreductase subunit C [Schinkia sp. CFF1]
MSEKDLEQLKKEAAEKAKAAALAKEQGADSDAGQAALAAAGPDATDAEKAASAGAAAAFQAEGATALPEGTDDKAKAIAAAKAKAAALAKQGGGETEAEATGDAPAGADDKAKAAAAAKAKAAAAAKAKAAAAAKAKAAGGEAPAGGDDDKAKAIAAAKAKAAAAAAAKAKAAGGATAAGGDDDKAKAIAAAKAKAAALAKAKTAGAGAGATEEAAPEAPSPNQPYLDKYIKVIKDHLGEDVLEDAYINKLSNDVPTLVAKPESYYKIAEFLKYNEQLGFDYLSEHHGSDFMTHMEVYNHFYSYKNRQSVALKVKINRDEATIDSLTPLWPGCDWPERESYDLLGIKYTNHPNLKRIMLADDWVGHPLRKDYEQYDVEV